MNDPDEARAALAAVTAAKARLAERSNWSLLRHAAAGALMALWLFAQSLGETAMIAVYAVAAVLALPPETQIFVGHDYLPAGRSDFAWHSTVAEQHRANVHVHDGVSEADFVAMRQARDATLEAPQLILPALQVNIRAGQLPPPSNGGQRYLKLPLNAI